jgi:hypothetical protein
MTRQTGSSLFGGQGDLGKKKKEKVEEFVLDKHAVLAEAAVQLMRAQDIAHEQRDVKKLIQISYAWSHLSEKFDVAEIEPEGEKKSFMGFTKVEVKDE